MTRKRTLLLASIGAMVLVGAVVGLRGPLPYLLAWHWQSKLDSVPDDQVPVLLGEVAALDEPGIPVLVASLASPREVVAREGRRVLHEELARWETLGPLGALPRLALLADALAEHVDQFGPAARAEAGRLATRILSWPLDAAVVDRAEVIASCEHVLRKSQSAAIAGGSNRSRSWPDPVASETSPDPPRLVARRPGVSSPVRTDRSPPVRIAELSPLAGGGLPVDELRTARLPGEAEADLPAGGSRMNEPQRLARPLEARPLAPDGRPGLEAPRSGSDRSSLDAPEKPASDGTRQVATTPSETSPAAPAAMDTEELMRRFAETGQRVPEAVRAELSRRGFAAMHFELARRLREMM